MSTRDKTIARLIEEDHRRLRSLMEAIAADIAEEPPEAFDDWKLTLLRKLRDFHGQLGKHFDLEEHGGFMAEVVSHAPRYHSRVHALVDEHRELLEALESVLGDLKEVDTAAAWHASRVPARLRALLELLKDQEAAATSLLQDTYFQDLGVGD